MTPVRKRKPFVPSKPSGTPLGEPRLCQGCDDWHPVGTTCKGGWAPWRPQ